MDSQQILMYLLVIFFVVMLFLLFREIFCWYWKIDEHLKNQKKIIERLDKLIGEEKPEKPAE